MLYDEHWNAFDLARRFIAQAVYLYPVASRGWFSLQGLILSDGDCNRLEICGWPVQPIEYR